MRQFYRFVLGEGWRSDDPSRRVEAPKAGRPLPKVLSREAVERLIAAALFHRRPVYMAFPADMAERPVLGTAAPIAPPASDPASLAAAVEAVAAALDAAPEPEPPATLPPSTPVAAAPRDGQCLRAGPYTEAQASALENSLAGHGNVKTFIAMRYWKPLTDQAAKAVKAFAPDEVVLLPLYPQYSTTTTGSSLKAWKKAYRKGPGRISTMRSTPPRRAARWACCPIRCRRRSCSPPPAVGSPQSSRCCG